MDAEQKRLAEALQRHRTRRQRGLDIAQAELDQLAALIPVALEVGLTKMQIHELSGVSRPTIDALLRRKVDTDRG
jgi:hypothetical protein